METVITRDTDILREYLVALDARERGLSPFARLAATIKLARLRRELNTAQLETTDEDVAALRREIDERLEGHFARRFESRTWGARLSVFLMLVFGQQLALALVMIAAMLFVRFAPVPRRWNPVLPHEDPGYLLVFIFVFFFATPMLALLTLFGGRYFRSWRKTAPATAVIFALSLLGAYLVLRDNEKSNPVRHLTSLEQFAKDREINVTNYRQWVEANWLMNDARFQRDYENYLRNGPGRWITSRIYAGSDMRNPDAAWRPKKEGDLPGENDALAVIGEYIDGGQDPDGFRDWLRYYLDRNRIYSEDRIDQEVDAMTGSANQRFLGIWQAEPYLKERDQRLYRAYLGSVSRSMKLWGIAWLALFTLVFLIIYLTGPALSFWERMAGNARGRRKQPLSFDSGGESRGPSRIARMRERYYSFPERGEITTPPFFDAPFKLLSRAHRAFMRLAVFTIIFVFCFWAFVYALDLSAGNENVSSQVALMRSHLLLGGSGEAKADETLNASARASSTYATIGVAPVEIENNSREAVARTTEPKEGQAAMAARIGGLERQLDEDDYKYGKSFKEQYKLLASQTTDINSLKNATAQLQQSTTGLPDQISQAGSQAEAKAGQALGDAAAAKQMAQTVEQQIASKLKELENRAASASQDASNAEAQASGVRTRTEKLETEVLNLTKQLEERTAELKNSTTKESEEQLARLDRLQRIAFSAIFSEVQASADEFESRLNSSFYRALNKGAARRDADALKQRIATIANELKDFNSDPAKQMLTQLEELRNRVEQLSARVK
jgi:hypothetical protein